MIVASICLTFDGFYLLLMHRCTGGLLPGSQLVEQRPLVGLDGSTRMIQLGLQKDDRFIKRRIFRLQGSNARLQLDNLLRHALQSRIFVGTHPSRRRPVQLPSPLSPRISPLSLLALRLRHTDKAIKTSLIQLPWRMYCWKNISAVLANSIPHSHALLHRNKGRRSGNS